MGEVKLEFGLRDHRIINVNELDISEKGKNCNCICPLCRRELIARLGNKNQRHFAHKKDDECNDAHAQQTAIHMLAKEIIEEKKRLRFPGFSAVIGDYMNDINSVVSEFRVLKQIRKEFNISDSKIVECDSVRLENKISSIIPDVVVEAEGKMCLIEIAVTNPVSDEKREKVRSLGLPMFEIDLKDYHKSSFTRDELVKAVVLDENNRKWINNPKQEEKGRKICMDYINSIIEEQYKEDKEMNYERVLSNDGMKTVDEECEQVKLTDKYKCRNCGKFFSRDEMALVGITIMDECICKPCSRKLK